MAKLKDNQNLSENQIQASFFEWIDWKAREDPRFESVFSIPNGSNKSVAARMLFKRTGLRPGVPDVFLAIPNARQCGLFIEFKTSKGRISDRQKDWHNRLEQSGYAVSVCRSLSEAIEAVEAYLLA